MHTRNIIETIIRFSLVTVFQIGVFFLSSKILSVSEFGFFNIYLALSYILSNILCLGVSNSTVYFYDKLNHFSTLRKIIINHSIVVLLIIIFIGSIFVVFEFWTYLLLAFYIYFQFLTLIVNGILQSENKISALNVINSLIWFGVFLILSLVFYFDINVDINCLLIIYIVVNFIVIVYGLSLLTEFKNVREIRLNFDVDRNDVFHFYSYGVGTFINGIISFLNHRLDLLIVGWFLGGVSSGYYSFASQVSEKMSLISQAFCTVLFPKLVRIESKPDKYRFLNRNIVWLLFLSFPFFIIFYFLYPKIFSFLFDDKYVESYEIINVLIFSVFIISVERLVLTLLTSLGLVKLNLKIGLVTMIFNIVFNLLLINNYGILGVAYATLTSSAISFAMAVVYMRKNRE